MATVDDVLKLINGSIEEKLAIIIKNTEKQLLNMLYTTTNSTEPEITYTIPENLEYIVTDVSLIRLGRLGSEGISSESVGGNNVHYLLPKTDFDSYISIITNYSDYVNNVNREGGLTFI